MVHRQIVFRLAVVVLVSVGVLLFWGGLLRPVLATPPAQEDEPALTIVKTAEGDGTIAPGETVRFHIAVTNTGATTATSVLVRDDYDQASLPTIEAGTSGAQNDGDVIVWQVGDLLPGEGWSTSYAATAVPAFAAGVTVVSNDATVYAADAQIAQARVELTVRAPQLTLTRLRQRVDDEGDIVPGATVRYTFRYGNNGTADATNVVIVEKYDATVVQRVEDIIGGGLQEGDEIRWNLGTVTAGASGEVSYEVTLKLALEQGDSIDVTNQAAIHADGVQRISAPGSFTLKTPILSIKRERNDLSGGAIEPGDTLRFIITIQNSGEADALDVVVLDDFDETVVAEVSEISMDGSEVEGAVRWHLTDPLRANGGEMTFSYQVRLISEIGQATSVVNKAIILIEDLELARAQTTMKIEPAAEEDQGTVKAVVEQAPQIFEQQPEALAWLVGALAGIAMLAVVGITLGGPVLMKEGWQTRHLQLALEGVAVVVLVGAVLILAMGSGIRQDGAVSILSTIGGYVLGRGVSKLRE